MMNSLISMLLWFSLAPMIYCVGQDKSYKPVNMASKIIYPKEGEDKSLNPIVYVHGLAAAKELWQDVPQMLSDATKRKSIIYDARNHGESDWTDNFTIDLMVEDLRYLMDSKNVSKAIIIGHSMGGMTSCLFALKYPERVEMFINEDMVINEDYIKATAPLAASYLQLWAEAVKHIPVELSAREGIMYAFNYLYDKYPAKEHLEVKEKVWNSNYPIKRTSAGYEVKHNINVIIKYLEEGIAMEKMQLEGIYNGPVYFMMSSLLNYLIILQDPNVKQHFPNAEVDLIDGVSHNMHLQYPEKIADTILSFYKKNFKISKKEIELEL